MNYLEVPSSYDINYVILSFVIAFAGSFVALSAARRIIKPNGQISGFDLMSASLALGGIGVWTMHFIGMLALDLEARIGYSMAETIGSFVLACLSTGFALTYVAKAPQHLGRLLIAGVALGLGVGAMHYLGMHSMRFGGQIIWSYSLIALSLVIAVVAATAALWLAFNTRPLAVRLAAALIMALAVCAMHYTGMGAADFVCTSPADLLVTPRGWDIVYSDNLTQVVLILAVGITVLLSLDQIAQRMAGAARQNR
ncbi:MAG: histidine kinase [Hylemonella sp.]|nr:histidine kinase [Hylemonella sp.]MDH5708053.1 histidine kinase [Hylemonella sp.]